MSRARQYTSLNNAEPKDLGSIEKVDEQKPVYKTFNEECWCSAWSPDGSYFAYSQGGGIVYLLPWDYVNDRLYKRPTADRTVQTENELNEENLLEGFPRIPSYNNCIINNEDEFSSFRHQDAPRGSVRIETGDTVWSMAFGSCTSMDNNKLWRRFRRRSDVILATGLSNGKIKLWGVNCGGLLLELLDHRGKVRSLSFPSNGSFQLISGGMDGTIKFWDLNIDGNMYKTLRFRDKNTSVLDCKWSPNCTQIAAVGTNKSVQIWTVSDLLKYVKLVGHNHIVSHCEYSPDSALFATSSYDTTVILWDPYTGDKLLIMGHMFPPPRPIYAGGANDHYVTGLSFSRDGQHIATTADDGYVRTWDITDVSNPESIAELPKSLCCSYNPSGHIIAVGDRYGNVTFYRPPQSAVSLQQLCRTTIRRHLSSVMVDKLQYPFTMKEFLKYHWQ